jgi:hypothetical protein
MRPLDAWPRLALLAVVLPVSLAILDRWLLAGPPRYYQMHEIVATYAIFTLQVAILGWAVGRGLRNRLVRWSVYVWALLLTDVQLITFALSDQYWYSPATVLAYAMLSAQAGLLAAWSMLGEMRWTWRLPIAFGAASVLGAILLMVNGSFWSSWWSQSQEAWPVIVLTQSAAAAAICLALSGAGYRMTTIGESGLSSDGPSKPNSRERRLQFSLRHLMIWITALGPAVLMLRSLHVFMTGRFGVGQWIEMITLGLCLAAVSLLAVWAAAGAEGAGLRLPLLLVLAPAMGLLLGALGVWGWWERIVFSYASGPECVVQWMIWTTLAGYFLAGMLLIFRAQGCRLVRSTNNS